MSTPNISCTKAYPSPSLAVRSMRQSTSQMPTPDFTPANTSKRPFQDTWKSSIKSTPSDTLDESTTVGPARRKPQCLMSKKSVQGGNVGNAAQLDMKGTS